jgi:hypothetical protein
MVDVVVTPANCIASANAKKINGIAGATILAGQTVYRDTTTKKFGLADADSATENVRTLFGIALHGASLNQPLTVMTEGDVTIGGTLVQGLVYCLSNTPGGIMPSADLSAGEYTTVIGPAISTTVLRVKLNAAGVAV